jgi:hypothetical protein
MKLQFIDVAIIVLYLVTMLLLAGSYARKRESARKVICSAWKRLPWYLLGLSDASDMFDISGTMWMVSLCFV